MSRRRRDPPLDGEEENPFDNSDPPHESAKPIGGIKDLVVGAPRDLWAIITVVLLESLAYFAMSFIFVLMLEREYGMDDVEASTTYAVFGIGISVYAIFFGWVVDRLQVRKALMIYATLGILSKTLLGLFPSRVMLWLVMMGPLSFALSIGGTAVLAGVRRYTTAATRNTAFSLRYIAMNVGALLAEPLTDGVRVALVPALEELGQRGYSLFVAMTAVFHLSSVIIIYCLVRDVRVDEVPPDQSEATGAEVLGGSDELYVSLAPSRKWPLEPVPPPPALEHGCNLCQRMRTLRSKLTPNLGRFIILSFGTMGAKSVFRYLDTLYPLWMSRADFPVDDPASVPFNTFLMINPIIVVLFTTALATFMERRQWHPYWVILVGTTISSLAPFWMMITQYFAVVFFITQLSLGEITWSPMLATYSCWFAPQGEEGVFFALATIPVFGAKAAAGYMSGRVLKAYCPPLPGNATEIMELAEEVPCSPVVWLIVSCVACSSPLVILACMRCLKIERPLETDTTAVPLEKIDASDGE